MAQSTDRLPARLRATAQDALDLIKDPSDFTNAGIAVSEEGQRCHPLSTVADRWSLTGALRVAAMGLEPSELDVLKEHAMKQKACLPFADRPDPLESASEAGHSVALQVLRQLVDTAQKD